MRVRLACLALSALFLGVPLLAQNVTGSGTANFIPIWTGATTLANSTIFESDGMVGIGTVNPTSVLTVLGPDGSQSAPNAIPVLQVTGGVGFQQVSRGNGGVGGGVNLSGGSGGRGFSLGSDGGTGGAVQLASGTGGIGSNHAQGGNGGQIALQPGAGGPGLIGGIGGSIALTPGAGGNGQDQGNGGAGGSLMLLAGVGGHAQTTGNGG
ncbi:MAG: hypothetical protein WCC92_18465, partial [Candidatus Korobacteraceae bacterium]